jgi:hypothetical protein
MQAENTQGVGNPPPTRPDSTPHVGNVRDSDTGGMPTRIMHTQAYQRGLRAGCNEGDTGELSECPYSMREMTEDFWRGVRDAISSANILISNMQHKQ